MSVISTPIPITYPAGTSPQPWPETSPCQGGKRVFVSTDHSYEAHWEGDKIVCDKLFASPDPTRYWRRSYAGVFDAEEIDGHLITVLHGENKNEIRAGAESINTVNGDKTCFSGYQSNGSYEDCWTDYFAFISAWCDGVDLGPIVWPRDGYLRAGGEQRTCGVRHPSSVVDHGYLYVFYLDCSFNGIAVARSPVENLANPSSFRTWTHEGWKHSLPLVMHGHVRFHEKGPDAVPILGRESLGYFSAVKIHDGTFLALEFCAEGGMWGHQQWVSKDLISWHREGPLLWASNDFGSSTVRYARPVPGRRALATTGSEAEWASW